MTFPALLRGRRVTHWIDNTGALAALIKGYARAEDLAKIVHAFAFINLGLQCVIWFEYVRSKANVADFPSRGDFALLRGLGAHCVPLVLPDPDWWEEPTRWYTSMVNAAAFPTQGAAARSHPLPPDADREQGAFRPRRRSRRAAGSRPRVFLRASPADATLTARAATEGWSSAIVDFDIAGATIFQNPFTMGCFNSNRARRREAVACHQRWLEAEPPIAANRLCNFDGSRIPSHIRPRETSVVAHRSATHVRSEIDALLTQYPHARAFRLCCADACSNCMCHGAALASFMQGVIGA